MTLRELEDELAAAGFGYVRCSRDIHRLYRNAAGRFVVVAQEHGDRYEDDQARNETNLHTLHDAPHSSSVA